MDPFDVPIEIAQDAAAAIAAGMKTVALADGDIHPQELRLIGQFEGEVSTQAPDDVAAVLNTPQLQDTYLRSLVLVALADGKVSPTEHEVIVSLAKTIQVAEAHVEEIVRESKLHFLHAFVGVRFFREEVYGIAEELGLTKDDVDAMFAEREA